MLPPPPPTDPDVPNYGIRFFAPEVRSGRLRYMPSMTFWSGPCASLHRTAASPARLSIAVSWTGGCGSVSSCLFPANGLHARRLPSLGRVPPSTVPRRRRYYEDATTSCTASPLTYWFRSRVPRLPPPSCSPKRSHVAGGITRAWTFGQPVVPCPGNRRVDGYRISQVP